MKVVLDTNIIVSALFWGGLPRKVLEETQRKHTLCFSQTTLQELKEVLEYPKFTPYIQKLNFNLEEFLEQLTENSLVISTPLNSVSIIKEHPADNKFLACAVLCQADFIISGDKHLLALKSFRDIPVVTAKQFLKQTGKRH